MKKLLFSITLVFTAIFVANNILTKPIQFQISEKNSSEKSGNDNKGEDDNKSGDNSTESVESDINSSSTVEKVKSKLKPKPASKE